MNYYVGNCTLSEEQKANLTNTHIYIPVSWVCSYTYMCTNMQVMVEVQYCWEIDIFSPILIFKIFSSETDKLTSHCFMWRRLAVFSSWVQPRSEDWMRGCSPTALQLSTTLYSWVTNYILALRFLCHTKNYDFSLLVSAWGSYLLKCHWCGCSPLAILPSYP